MVRSVVVVVVVDVEVCIPKSPHHWSSHPREGHDVVVSEVNCEPRVAPSSLFSSFSGSRQIPMRTPGAKPCGRGGAVIVLPEVGPGKLAALSLPVASCELFLVVRLLLLDLGLLLPGEAGRDELEGDLPSVRAARTDDAGPVYSGSKSCSNSGRRRISSIECSITVAKFCAQLYKFLIWLSVAGARVIGKTPRGWSRRAMTLSISSRASSACSARRRIHCRAHLLSGPRSCI